MKKETKIDSLRSLMPRPWRGCGILMLTWLFVACGGSPEDPGEVEPLGEAEEAYASPGAAELELGHVELEKGKTVTFTALEADGTIGAVVVSESFPLTEPAPLAEFKTKGATPLELFRALSGAEVPSELVELHRMAARHAGRDPDVVRTLVRVEPLVEKAFGTTACTNTILAHFDFNQLIANNVNTTAETSWDVNGYEPYRNFESDSLQQNGRAGICADSQDAAVRFQFEWRVIFSGSAWNFVNGSLTPTDAGWARWHTVYTSPGHEVKHRLRALGGDHHVRTGLQTVLEQ